MSHKTRVFIAVLVMLGLPVLVFFGAMQRYPVHVVEAVTYGNGMINTANDVYEIDITDNNTLTVTAAYYSNPSVLESYHTEYLCITRDRTNGNPRGGSSPWKEFYVGNHRIQTYGGVSYDTFEIPAAEFVAAVREWYTTEELLDSGGVTVYLNDLFVKKTRAEAGGVWNIRHNGTLYDTLDKIRSAASWSTVTYNNFAKYYDAAVTIRFNETEYEIHNVYVEDGRLREEKAVTAKGVAGDWVMLDLPVKTTRNGTTYFYSNRYKITGSSDLPKEDSFWEGELPKKMELSGAIRCLWVIYAKTDDGILPEPTKPVPTGGVNPTMPPIPSYTPTPVPKPTSVVTPSPEPTKIPVQGETYLGWEYYFTTEEGYTIENIQKQAMGYELAFSIGGQTLSSNELLKRERYYSIGMDSLGNQWFFIPEGKNAEYVHPYKYQGYDATTAEEISRIKELIFPEILNAEGTQYTVHSIGGGMERYHKQEAEMPVNSGILLEDWNYGIISGTYEKYLFSYSGSGQRNAEWSAQYQYGVLGTGKILSKSQDASFYGTVYNATINIRNYRVYNTTLRSITIPDTVEIIRQGAFYGCQALEEIKGAGSVLVIEEEAFCGGESTRCKTSRILGNGADLIREYYFYNESYSQTTKTQIMERWEQQVELKNAMRFPDVKEAGKLCELGIRSFAYHPNLSEVILGVQTEQVRYYAFAYDDLPWIRILNKQMMIEEAPAAQLQQGHLTLSRTARFDGIYYETCAKEAEQQIVGLAEKERFYEENRLSQWKMETERTEEFVELLRPYYEYRALAGFFYDYYTFERRKGDVWADRDAEIFYQEYQKYKRLAEDYIGNLSVFELSYARQVCCFASGFLKEEYDAMNRHLSQGGNSIPAEYREFQNVLQEICGNGYLERLYQSLLNYEPDEYYGGNSIVFERSGSTSERVDLFLKEWKRERLQMCRAMEKVYENQRDKCSLQMKELLQKALEYRKLSAKAWDKGDTRTIVYAESDSKAADYVKKWNEYYVMGDAAIRLDGRGATKQEQFDVELVVGEVCTPVLTPEKEGYLFQGFYTEIRGGGTRIYDENGIATERWNGEATVLYACWKQKEVIPPKFEQEVPEIPEEERITLRIQNDAEQIRLQGEGFETMAIPSGEEVRFRGEIAAWEAEFSLVKKYGVSEIVKPVLIRYHTVKEDPDTEELIIGDPEQRVIECRIPVLWSYWRIEGGEIRVPDRIRIINNVFSGKSTEITVNRAKLLGVLPELIYQCHDEERFVLPREEMTEKAEELSIVSEIPGADPDVDAWLAAAARELFLSDEVTIGVRSDFLQLNGVMLLSDRMFDLSGQGPMVTGCQILSENIGKIPNGAFSETVLKTDTTIQNGIYESETEIIYAATKTVGETGKTQKKRRIIVNPIGIHTPVFCNAVLESHHETEHQEVGIPDGCNVLVLDETGRTSDFFLTVSNFGFHSNLAGFGTQNYEKYVAEKNGVAQNEVCFPFDVILDVGSDGKRENDIRINANTWYLIGSVKQRFYLEADTKPGKYRIEVRTVARNGQGREELRQEIRNTERAAHCTYDSVSVYITGALHDFCVEKITGNGVWKGDENVQIPIGGSERGADLWNTLPLRNGVHPLMKNAGELIAGDEFEFTMKSIGFADEQCLIRVVPHFYYLKEGKRERVQIYYDLKTEKGTVLKKLDETEAAFVIEADGAEAVRIWKAGYRIPDTLYAADDGFDVFEYQRIHGLSFQEEFWKYDGSLILSFEAVLETESGRKLYYGDISGKVRNNIWRKEADSVVRIDRNGNEYEILGGEVAVFSATLEKECGFSVYGVY